MNNESRTNDNTPVGLVGLGLVGTSLAKRFIQAGYDVIGYDIDPKRCDQLCEMGVVIVESPAILARYASTVVLSLPTSKQVEEVIFQPSGLLSEPVEHRLIVDTTTGDPFETISIVRRVQSLGHSYVDACIIGSSKQVLEGGAVVCMGADEPSVQSCVKVLGSFTNQIFHMGEPGKGIQAKLVANLVLGLNRLALAEGLMVAETLRLDLDNVLQLLKSSAAYSRVMDTKGNKMLRNDFIAEARLSQHLKDVNVILAMGERLRLTLPVTSLHRQILEKGINEGLGDLDNSAIIEALRRLQPVG